MIEDAPVPPEPRAVARLEVQHDGQIHYLIQSETKPPEHPHSLRYFGLVYGAMGTCRYPGRACKIEAHACEYGCVWKGEKFDRTRRDAEAMCAGLNAAGMSRRSLELDRNQTGSRRGDE